MRLALVLALAAAGGWLAARLGVPLPWMIGPLLATAALRLADPFAFTVPVQVRPFGQVTIAAQVGLAFTPAAVTAVLELAPLLVAMSLMTAGSAFVAATLLGRMSGMGFAPALLATMPTSPVEAAVLAEKFGVPPAPIILAQTMRIAGIVVIVPIGIYLIDGWPDRSGLLGAAAAFDPVALALLYGVAIAGALCFRGLGLSNPYFLGPLAFVSVLSGLGGELAPCPPVLLALAQLVLGTWLGSNFHRELFGRAGRLAWAVAVSGLLFLSLATLCALAIAVIASLPWEEMVLGAAPGGVTEMALTAKYMGLNVALITAFQITRIFVIMPNIPWIVAGLHRRSG